MPVLYRSRGSVEGVPSNNRSRFRRVFGITMTVCCLAVLSRFVLLPPIAHADTPAVTDFGLDMRSGVMGIHHAEAHAMFLTLYGDGRKDVQVRPIGNDAVVTFAGAHGAWNLNGQLSWFLEMPVYVRVVSTETHRGDVSDM